MWNISKNSTRRRKVVFNMAASKTRLFHKDLLTLAVWRFLLAAGSRFSLSLVWFKVMDKTSTCTCQQLLNSHNILSRFRWKKQTVQFRIFTNGNLKAHAKFSYRKTRHEYTFQIEIKFRTKYSRPLWSTSWNSWSR